MENRIRLYGLYKQATEGNVDGVMLRPVGHSPEDESAKRKWDAWKEQEGLSKTEAKRRYIECLISTMKTYASGTHEARELLSELEYLWDQIKEIQPSPSPPMTPMNFTRDNMSSSFISSFNDFNDPIRNELRDVKFLKKEVQLALRRLNDELSKKDENWIEKYVKLWNWKKFTTLQGVQKFVGLLLKIALKVVKSVVLELVILCILINLVKLSKKVEINGKLLKIFKKVLNFEKIVINVN